MLTNCVQHLVALVDDEVSHVVQLQVLALRKLQGANDVSIRWRLCCASSMNCNSNGCLPP